MSGEELNPQISQINTDVNTDDAAVIASGDPSGQSSQSSIQSSVPPFGQNDESLTVGFGQLVRRVAHLETLLYRQLNGEAQTLEISRPAERLPVDGNFISPAQSDQAGQTVVLAWQSAPLPLRLKFVRELLPPEHPLLAILKEAIGLEELRGNGHELETWLTGYPSLFADAVERLETQPPCGATPGEALAVETLSDARHGFAGTIDALGIEWIRPAAGASIDEEHEVVGEEESRVAAGRVARTRRRGFRLNGRLVLPAQVTRAWPTRTGIEAKEQNAAEEASPTPTNQSPITGAQPASTDHDPRMMGDTPLTTNHQPPTTVVDPWPEWLRTLHQRSMGSSQQTVNHLVADLRELAQTVSQVAAGARGEADLSTHLEPLLPLLGARHVPSFLALSGEWGDILSEVRDDLLTWLHTTLDITSIAPAVGERCDVETMQVTGIRRTAHAHEDGTVAKVERIGLRHGNRVLFRAQVLRYELGANYE